MSCLHYAYIYKIDHNIQTYTSPVSILSCTFPSDFLLSSASLLELVDNDSTALPESREVLFFKLSLSVTSNRRRDGILPVDGSSVGTIDMVVSAGRVTGIGKWELMAAEVYDVGKTIDTTGIWEEAIVELSVGAGPEFTVIIRDNVGLLLCNVLANWTVLGLLACSVLFNDPVSNSLIGDNKNVPRTGTSPLLVGYMDGVLANCNGKQSS